MKKITFLIILVGVLILGGYGAFTYYDNHFKFGRMWETPSVRPHEEPLPIMEAGVVPFKGGEAIYRETPGEELKSPLAKGNPKDIELGKIEYFTFCAQCHGKYHDGNGTVGQSFYPLPTDLRSEKVQSQPEGILFQGISYGVQRKRQPALASTIRVLERWRIIAYVKSLGIKKPHKSTKSEKPTKPAKK
jgi:mono/diheme cytochrome c family protein